MKRRTAFILGLAVLLVVGGVGLLFAIHDSDAAHQGGSGHSGAIAILPIFTSLIPIFIAARRRKGCKNG